MLMFKLMPLLMPMRLGLSLLTAACLTLPAPVIIVGVAQTRLVDLGTVWGLLHTGVCTLQRPAA